MLVTVPDLLLAPYLPLRSPASLGDWELIPFRVLFDAGQVPDELPAPVKRLIDAYTLPHTSAAALGAVIIPSGTHVGAPFDRSLIGRLDRALLAGAIANNPRLTDPEEEADPNAGFAIATAENALLYGHPLGNGDSYVIQAGVLAQAMSINYAPPEKPLPKIAPPSELPKPVFTVLDIEIAIATVSAFEDDQFGRRLRRTLDWYRIAFSNAHAITPDVRVGAARSALEVLTGVDDKTRKLVRAYGRLLQTDQTPQATYRGGSRVCATCATRSCTATRSPRSSGTTTATTRSSRSTTACSTCCGS
jgi:hypothetical protein